MSRKSWGSEESAFTIESCESFSTTRSWSSTCSPGGLDHLVREVVVALLDRLHVGRPLHLAAAVEVEVREDPEQPGAEVRARGVRLPAPERPTVGVLDKILSLLSGSDEPARDAIHLVGERESLFLEADAIARLRRDPASIDLGLCVTHRANRIRYPR